MALTGPVYTEFYVSERSLSDSVFVFPVTFHSDEVEWQGYLRKGGLKDLHEHVANPVRNPIYVVVEHPLEYPYAKWDCIETEVDTTISDMLGTKAREPRKFAQASIAFTPQMALI